jgi:hypothetical protein
MLSSADGAAAATVQHGKRVRRNLCCFVRTRFSRVTCVTILISIGFDVDRGDCRTDDDTEKMELETFWKQPRGKPRAWRAKHYCSTNVRKCFFEMLNHGGYGGDSIAFLYSYGRIPMITVTFRPRSPWNYYTRTILQTGGYLVTSMA